MLEVLEKKNLKSLSDGEKIWVGRVRVGWTQYEAAVRAKVSHTTFVAFELNRIEVPGDQRAFPGRITKSEALRLARRRSGWGSDEVARRVGISRQSLRAWELEGDDRLIVFWRRLGYVFGDFERN